MPQFRHKNQTCFIPASIQFHCKPAAVTLTQHLLQVLTWACPFPSFHPAKENAFCFLITSLILISLSYSTNFILHHQQPPLFRGKQTHTRIPLVLFMISYNLLELLRVNWTTFLCYVEVEEEWIDLRWKDLVIALIWSWLLIWSMCMCSQRAQTAHAA